MPIYTRTGDKGKTSLFDGTRVLKSHPRVNSYGTIDELNSMIGVAMAHMAKGKGQIVTLRKELENIQHDLLEVGSALATPHPLPVVGLAQRAKDFEQLIDEMTAKLPELKKFILPGGRQAGSFLHVARTIVRRAERELVELMQKEEVDQTIVIYLNRLSDLLFTMSRFVNHLEKEKEIIWIKK
ncbi:cob(I)yrinic acid a,c-diamide adenosyltransferase [Candidatus Gottesmanbacteria bacterium]|nr:cob(I)yrinic acid a,c-diamide adenosyltransferase [Candidatus Gottesmanbacteria bacterium]